MDTPSPFFPFLDHPRLKYTFNWLCSTVAMSAITHVTGAHLQHVKNRKRVRAFNTPTVTPKTR